MKLAAVAVAGLALFVQNPPTFTVVKAKEIKWADAQGMPPGVKSAVEFGNPAKEPFLLQMKIPAGTVIPPHTHSTDEVGTVLSGTVLIGRGKQVDEGAATEVDAGGYFVIPAGDLHWGKAKTDAVIVRYSSGPADIQYYDPKKDPVEKK